MTDIENYYVTVPAKASKYPVIHPAPGMWYSITWARPSDFFVAGLLGGASVPLGYAIGRPFRKAGMLITGFTGALFSVFYVVGRSGLRLMGDSENAPEVAKAQRIMDGMRKKQ